MSDQPPRPDGGSYRDGIRAGMPFGLATVALGVSFGILTGSLGWGVVAPVVFSIVAFSGSAQFAVATVLGAGGSVLAAIAAAVLLSTRFLPMGVAVAPFLMGGRLRRILEAQTIVDASWALASRGEGRFDRKVMIGATVPQAIAWVGGTVIGVLAGGIVGDIERAGLDVVFPVFFLALVMDELKNGGKRAIAVAILAAAIALTTIPIAPPGVPVLVATGAALIGLHGGDE